MSVSSSTNTPNTTNTPHQDTPAPKAMPATPVRAKFRCMSVTKNYEGQTFADFRPACPQKDDKGTPQHEENKVFWKWTPGGEMTLGYWGDAPHLVPGAYYYIDLTTPADAGTVRPWRLTGRTEYMSSEQLDVELCADWMLASEVGPDGLRNGILKMAINNEAAWPLFLTAQRGQKWSVAITKAV